MAERFEYDVVNLKAEFDAQDRRSFRWKSRRGGCHDVGHSELEEMLNRLGQDGWHVISHDTDGRFGSTLILERRLSDDQASNKKTPKFANAESTPPPAPIVVSAPPVNLAPLLAELQALRQEVAEQRRQQLVDRPLDAAKRLQEEQRQREAEEANRYLHSEAFREALAPVLEELKAQRDSKPIAITLEPVMATMTPEAVREIGAELVRALAPKDSPVASHSEPKFEKKRPWLSWSWVTGIGR